MTIIGIIPARMGSTRFPGKPMARIVGMPMIGHVYLRASKCPLLSATYVATCDPEILEYITSIGGKAVMTSPKHERCSDRTAEALLLIEKELGRKCDIVVMIQGDEPLVTPEMIERALQPMVENPLINVVNLMQEIENEEDFEDPNEVKVVTNRKGCALYFSREPIPSRKKTTEKVPMWKQVCIIPFRREYLLKFNSLKPTPLENIESVDMMRILEHGEDVYMVKTPHRAFSVDTPEDLAFVAQRFSEDTLWSSYCNEMKE